MPTTDPLALPAVKPEWGTPEHGEYLSLLGRRAFISGHMGPGGFDHDKRAEADAYMDYDTFPQQSGGAV
jgi:hypothetical protein